MIQEFDYSEQLILDQYGYNNFTYLERGKKHIRYKRIGFMLHIIEKLGEQSYKMVVSFPDTHGKNALWTTMEFDSLEKLGYIENETGKLTIYPSKPWWG